MPFLIQTLEELGIERVLDVPDSMTPRSFAPYEVGVFAGIINHEAPKKYFEFGTGLGASALHVRKYAPKCEIWTLDSLYRELVGVVPDAHYLIGYSLTCPLPRALFGTVDIVLVDGGHYTPMVANDTGRAMDLVREGGLVIWHDVSVSRPSSQVPYFLEAWWSYPEWTQCQPVKVAGTAFAIWRVEGERVKERDFAIPE